MDIWFESEGRGSPLVFLHAAVADSRMWDPQWNAFGQSHQVVRCDFRGFGRTGLEPGEFSHARDVVSALDRLGIESAIFIGASLGARIAMEIALSQPHRVDGLVLVGAVLRDHQFSQAVIDFWASEDAALEAGDIDATVELSLAFWVDGPDRRRANLSDETRTQVIDMLRAAVEHQLPLLHDSEERTIVDDLPQRLAEITAPTMVVVGDQDAPDLIAIADRLARSIPSAEQLTIPDTAHLPSLEAPELFNATLRAFVGRLR